MKPLAVGETCAHLAVDTHGCRQPRACASCLDTAGCMVNAIGKCVDAAALDPALDFVRAVDRGLVAANATMAARPRMRAPQSWQFSAGTTRYCDSRDATCSTCVRNNFWRSNMTAPDSRFCLGDDGTCVCVDVCERPYYMRNDCSSHDDATAGYSSADIADTLWRGILGLVALSFMLLVLFLRRKCSAEELQRVQRLQARQARRTARSRALGVNALTLTGWESYRRDLIDKEKARQDEQPRGEGTNTESEASTSSSIGEIGAQVRTPRASESPLTTYVSLDESETTDPGATSSASETSRAPSHVSRAAYNEATPGRQQLAPLAAQSHQASA